MLQMLLCKDLSIIISAGTELCNMCVTVGVIVVRVVDDVISDFGSFISSPATSDSGQ